MGSKKTFLSLFRKLIFCPSSSVIPWFHIDHLTKACKILAQSRNSDSGQLDSSYCFTIFYFFSKKCHFVNYFNFLWSWLITAQEINRTKVDVILVNLPKYFCKQSETTEIQVLSSIDDFPKKHSRYRFNKKNVWDKF